MKNFKIIFRWGLALLFVAYIVHFFMTNKQNLNIAFHLNPRHLVVLLFLFALSHALYSYRFWVVLRKCSQQTIPLFECTKLVVIGRLLSTLAPQAGNVYNSIYLKKNFQVSYTKYVSSFFSMAWLDTGMNLLVSVGIIWMVKPDMEIGPFLALHILLFLTALIILTPVMLAFILNRLRIDSKQLRWLKEKAFEALEIPINNFFDIKYIITIFLSGMIAFAVMVAAFFICFKSFEIRVDLPVLALFYVVLKLLTQIIITPGNLGVRELAYGLLSSQVHIGMGQGIIVSVVIRILNLLVLILLGAFFFITNLMFPGKTLT